MRWALLLSQLTYHSPSRLVPDYIKSSNQKMMGSKSKSTMQYNSGQYATVTHYRRGGQDRGPGYQNRCVLLQFDRLAASTKSIIPFDIY